MITSALLAAMLAGCAGSGDDNADNGGGNGCEPPATPTVFLSTNVQPIYDVSCALAGCHLGAGSPGGINLAAGASWDATVDVKAVQRPKLFLVEPGNPDDSYLVRKIEGGPDIAGDLMPRGCPGAGENGAVCLTLDDISAIRQWITECALDN